MFILIDHKWYFVQAALEEAEATLEQEENKNARIQLEIEQVNRYRVF